MNFSIYRFNGRFRLYRDLRKFPFDESLFRIALTNPIIPAADLQEAASLAVKASKGEI